MKKSVWYLKEKNDTTLVLIYFQIDCKYLTFIMTDPLNIIFDEFGIYLPGYRNNIELSCLYIPQGHYCISFLWLWRTDKYVK